MLVLKVFQFCGCILAVVGLVFFLYSLCCGGMFERTFRLYLVCYSCSCGFFFFYFPYYIFDPNVSSSEC